MLALMIAIVAYLKVTEKVKFQPLHSITLHSMINHSTPDQQITSQFESNVMSIYKFLALKFAISTSSKNANPIPDGKRKLAIQQRTAT